MFMYSADPDDYYDSKKSEFLQGFDLDMLDDMLAKDNAEDKQAAAAANNGKPAHPAPAANAQPATDVQPDENGGKPVSRFFHKGESGKHSEHEDGETRPETPHHAAHHAGHVEKHAAQHHHEFAASVIAEVYK